MKTITKRILFLVAVLLAVPAFIFAFSKGDLLIAQDSNSMARLPLGQDGQVLTVSSTAPLGMAWVTPTIPVKHFQVDTGKTLTTGLQAYYKLEDANDFWGTNNFTNGGATFVTGKVNNAVDFGSISPSTKSLTIASNLGTSAEVSFSTWVNITTQVGTNSNATIWQLQDNVNKVNYSINYNDTNGIKGLRVSRSLPGAGENVAIFTYTLIPGTWYHIVYTYNGSIVTCYVNNTSIGTFASTGYGNTDQGLQFFIGNGIAGKEDEFGVWSRALSPAEISDLYNGGSGQTIVQ